MNSHQPAPHAEPRHRRVTLMGIGIDRITQREAIDHIMRALGGGRGGWAITPNLEILRRLARDPQYAALCSGASLWLADGMPLIWASRIQGSPLPERIAGSDLIWSLTARAAREGRSVFFLGGNPGAAERAAAVLKSRHPGLRIAGVEFPPFGFEGDSEYLEGLRARLGAAAPDICYVALGAGRQDRLIHDLRGLLPRTWFVGIGISFSFVSGEVRRAPRLVQRLGLEWAHRLAQEPRRLARRYLIDGLPFAFRLFLSAARERLAPSRPREPGAARVR